MIEIIDITVENLESYDRLMQVVSDELYIDQATIDELKLRIGMNARRILVEHPYRDSDFSSVYSSFYSKKHKQVPRDCYRLHFFCDADLSNENYCGYLILRPSQAIKPNMMRNCKGRAQIDPKIFGMDGSYLILCDKFTAHIGGGQFQGRAFPWMAQETDISRCAHSASWSIIRYFSQKYNYYQERTLNDIVELVPQYLKRKTPSEGLNLLQISSVLSEAGFHPLFLSEKAQGTNDFLENIFIYLESGIPMIAAIEATVAGKPFNHAICLVGHSKLNLDKELDFSVDKYKLSCNYIESFVAVDDNHLPYIEISDQPGIAPYKISDIKSVIVPLYEKMFLPASVVMNKAKYLIESGMLNLKENIIVRPYLTSSKSLKLRTQQNNSMHSELRSVILATPMPKFIWCVDFSSQEEFKNGKCSTRVVIDATAGTYDVNPFILLQDNEGVSFYDYSDNVWQGIKVSIEPYFIYRNNLEEV